MLYVALEKVAARQDGESPVNSAEHRKAKIAAIVQAVEANHANGNRIGHGWLLAELRQLSAIA
jgi:ribosomal protein L13E